MPERRGTRFVVEVVFLAALATALGFAHLSALEIVGGMAAGWLVVAALEWAAWRGEPHYGSGLPPKYFIPGVNLPPPQPLEQFDQGYPGAGREDAPTWIASAALRAELLGEWPVAPLLADDDLDEEVDEHEIVVVPTSGDDPWTVASLPAAPLGEEDEEDKPAPALAPPRPRTTSVRVPAPGGRMALYRFDPLAGDAAPRWRLRRGPTADPADAVEVAARPAGPRPVPSGLR